MSTDNISQNTVKEIDGTVKAEELKSVREINVEEAENVSGGILPLIGVVALLALSNKEWQE